MKILYQYRSGKLDAPPGCANCNRVHWPDDPYDFPEEFSNDANSGVFSEESIHRADETVNLINHPQFKSDSPPTENSYSFATYSVNDAGRINRQICDSFHLPDFTAPSEWLDDGCPVRLPDRDPLISEPEELLTLILMGAGPIQLPAKITARTL